MAPPITLYRQSLEFERMNFLRLTTTFVTNMNACVVHKGKLHVVGDSGVYFRVNSDLSRVKEATTHITGTATSQFMGIVSVGNGSALLVCTATFPYGIWRSTDNGDSWTQVYTSGGAMTGIFTDGVNEVFALGASALDTAYSLTGGATFVTPGAGAPSSTGRSTNKAVWVPDDGWYSVYNSNSYVRGATVQQLVAATPILNTSVGMTAPTQGCWGHFKGDVYCTNIAQQLYKKRAGISSAWQDLEPNFYTDTAVNNSGSAMSQLFGRFYLFGPGAVSRLNEQSGVFEPATLSGFSSPNVLIAQAAEFAGRAWLVGDNGNLFISLIN